MRTQADNEKDTTFYNISIIKLNELLKKLKEKDKKLFYSTFHLKWPIDYQLKWYIGKDIDSVREKSKKKHGTRWYEVKKDNYGEILTTAMRIDHNYVREDDPINFEDESIDLSTLTWEELEKIIE